MPLQNRVTPTSDIIAIQARGNYMGNRGILHNGYQEVGLAKWKHKAWIICVLDFKNRQRQVMSPNRYTELFFYDEATALAAGHRPCAECQRQRFNEYQHHWQLAFGTKPKAGEMDTCLHQARVISHTRQQVRTHFPIEDIPNGAFVVINEQACLKWGNQFHPWSWDGYDSPINIQSNKSVEMLTPVPTAKILHTGYQPDIIGL